MRLNLDLGLDLDYSELATIFTVHVCCINRFCCRAFSLDRYQCIMCMILASNGTNVKDFLRQFFYA